MSSGFYMGTTVDERKWNAGASLWGSRQSLVFSQPRILVGPAPFWLTDAASSILRSLATHIIFAIIYNVGVLHWQSFWVYNTTRQSTDRFVNNIFDVCLCDLILTCLDTCDLWFHTIPFFYWLSFIIITPQSLTIIPKLSQTTSLQNRNTFCHFTT